MRLSFAAAFLLAAAGSPSTITASAAGAGAASETILAGALADFGAVPRAAALVGGKSVFPQFKPSFSNKILLEHLETRVTPRFIEIETNVLTPEECAQILRDSPEDSVFVAQGPRARTIMPVARDIFNRFVNKSAFGEDPSFAARALPITRVTETTGRHQDHYVEHSDPNRLGQVVDEAIVLMYLNDNPDAGFVYGDQRVPAKCGTKVTFHGGYSHFTELPPGGQPIKFLGPSTHSQGYAVSSACKGCGSGCFTEETTVRMADGTVKRIADIQIGDNVAKGGLVTSIMSFAHNEADNLCRIDENLVATRMHMMIAPDSEGFVQAQEMRIESSAGEDFCDQKHSGHVYDIDTEKHVIEFENGIVATDFNEHEIIPKFFEIEKEMALEQAKAVADLHPDSLFLYDVDFSGETLIKMQDGSFKAIEDIELNDVVALGGRVTGVFQIDGSSETRLCRVAPNVVVCEYLVYLHGAFVEADYVMTCEEAPAKTLYHIDTEKHLIELKDDVFSVDYDEHAPLLEFTAKEMEMTKDLVEIAKATM